MKKVTPRTDNLGDVTYEYNPEKHPVPKFCHVHLRWAEEKCPLCDSALLLYYSPSLKHRVGQFALTSEEAHPYVFVTCVNCGTYSIVKGPSVIFDGFEEKQNQK